MSFEFNWKFKEYEIRKTHGINSTDEYWELVKWQEYRGKPSCFALAFFVKDSEGYDIKFVGNRPFEHIAKEDLLILWDALKMASDVLDSYFKIQENINRANY